MISVVPVLGILGVVEGEHGPLPIILDILMLFGPLPILFDIPLALTNLLIRLSGLWGYYGL